METSKALFDRVIINPLPDPETTASGLFIPGMSKERPARGEVVITGTTTIVQAGDIVLYNRNAGTAIDIPEGSFITMRENAENIYVIIGHRSIAE